MAYKGQLGGVFGELDEGVNVDVRGAQDRTPLHRAVGGNNSDIVAALIERGANVNLSDKGGKTPLHWAAIVGSVECGTVLFRQGDCDLDARNKQGRTACHLASTDGRPEFVSWLIESGADITLLDGAGHTAYDLGKFCLI